MLDLENIEEAQLERDELNLEISFAIGDGKYYRLAGERDRRRNESERKQLRMRRINLELKKRLDEVEKYRKMSHVAEKLTIKT
ncbi:hypothetical protein B0O99DRAFT_628358 [Bisporella sp. PMI_857]|nr:hypothetical protein B0O99DRAFT_628358 [Bisporella sp. PMI_857]